MTLLAGTRLDDLVAFHGHFCPGLATGVRVAEAALSALGERADDEELVAVVETNNCAVDAIQFLVGCTYGKGNLIHRDHGKNVFTLARRSDGRAVRIATRPGAGRALTPEQERLVARVRAGEATAQERQQYQALWDARGRAVLDMPLEELLEVETLEGYVLPDRAVIEPSVTCDGCGALVMASRLTTIGAERFCATCQAERGRATLYVTQIGIVENELLPGEAPSRARSPRSRIVVDEAYRPGLEGLEPGQTVEVLYYFDGAPAEVPLRQHPRGDRAMPKRGVFALRSPHRPSPIGLTSVEILEIEPDGLVVAGLDAWHGSPVLDIKPTVR
jgi:formylmethanofuran dehydrogenase subunit E